MKTRRLGVRAALVDGAVIRGDVEIAGDVIAGVGVSPGGDTGIAVPGYVDLQVNGFGGVDFLAADVEDHATAGAALAAYGVTAYQPTLVSSPTDAVVTALERIGKAQVDSAPRILGVHLEGPFLSPKWKGAHDERYIVPPDLDLARTLCESGPVTYMTIAPEQPGGFELLDWLVRRGIVVAVGHTDADAATANAAFNRGARAVTHLHNAQRRFASRDPGIAGVAMTRPGVTVEAIADFVHMARETLMVAWLCARERFALVTDSIAAAGFGPGEYALGDRTIHVTEDAARLADGTLAGSVLTMDRAVRNLVSLGVAWPDAVRAATTTPANLVGHGDLGTLRPATPADIVVLDDALHPQRTLVAGRQIWARS
jgi:N-acetylglucosamine-6-phosphate deacetylase